MKKGFIFTKLTWTVVILRQLTDGDYDDIDPIYLPDGHIMFITTRCHTYVRCMPHANSYVLARCDADGKNIYLVSRSNECDWLPALLDDGRVIYSRWEYTDKPLWRIQSLWTTNPDGTQHGRILGQPKRLARSSRPTHARISRDTPRDVYRRRPPRLVRREHRHCRSRPRT